MLNTVVLNVMFLLLIRTMREGNDWRHMPTPGYAGDNMHRKSRVSILGSTSSFIS